MFGFTSREPTQFGDGERGHGHASHRIGPRLRIERVQPAARIGNCQPEIQRGKRGGKKQRRTPVSKRAAASSRAATRRKEAKRDSR